jgi:pimeloyl-ACP methyl ester carboxylesterase
MIVGVLAGCGPSGPTPVPPTPTPTLKGKVDIGGYSLYIQCAGEGSPTVVMDHGLGSIWRPVAIVDAVKPQTRICFYDRAGLGSSDPSPKKPRTSGDMMKDLHALLTNAHIAGPYVLVGHSIAGFNVRVYAKLYPEEVVGMVMIDPAYPDWIERWLAVLPPESADDPTELKDFRAGLKAGYLDPSMAPENIDTEASTAETRACGSLGDIPLVVLSAARDGFGGLPGDLEQRLQQEWNTMHKELSQLSSNGTFVLAEKSGHSIHQDEPQLVIDAILKVVAEARK